eukprot:TRINITY_DN3136_c0_g1_i2.p2 TRINITY_DN3136_c0_g1~~TRINITY_DN3136_c0_g1_i2.p2  ORF type:complete len:255 (+),score=42.91 TRINITY_DN3136_c0_g1_i2:242-1006(+)
MTLCMMGSIPPSSLKSAMNWIVVLTVGCHVLFTALMSTAAESDSIVAPMLALCLLLPVSVLLQIAFIIVANRAYLSLYNEQTSLPVDPRRLRGYHLGWSIAGLLIFPPFFWCIVPYVLYQLAHFRDAVEGFGGVKWSGLVSWVASIMFFVLLCTFFGAESYEAWPALLTWSLFMFFAQCVFIYLADVMIQRSIKQLCVDDGSAGVVSARVVTPGAVKLEHACPSCSVPLEFIRTGPLTQVQCYKCESVVEFETE